MIFGLWADPLATVVCRHYHHSLHFHKSYSFWQTNNMWRLELLCCYFKTFLYRFEHIDRLILKEWSSFSCKVSEFSCDTFLIDSVWVAVISQKPQNLCPQKVLGCYDLHHKGCCVTPWSECLENNLLGNSMLPFGMHRLIFMPKTSPIVNPWIRSKISGLQGPKTTYSITEIFVNVKSM